MGKKTKALSNSYSLSDDDTKEGPWQIYKGKNNSSKSATRKQTLAATEASAISQVLGSMSHTAASISKRATLASMKKLEDCLLESRLLLAASIQTQPIAGGTNPTLTQYRQVRIIDHIVDALKNTIVRSFASRDLAANPLPFLNVTFTLLGVGELDSPSGCLQWALGMALVQRLHGEVCEGVGRIVIKRIITYDPLVNGDSASQLAGSEEASPILAPATPPAPSVQSFKGLEGYIKGWNTNKRTNARPDDELPLLSNISFDDINRFGAYQIEDPNEVLIAFTPHCPRALYHNLIVANLNPSGDGEPANHPVGQLSSLLSPLSRLIIIGNDITRYIQSDRRCISGAISAAADKLPAGSGVVRQELLKLINSTTEYKKSLLSSAPLMTVLLLESMFTAAASASVVTAQAHELTKQLPNSEKALAVESEALGPVVASRVVNLSAKGKYGQYSYADAERAFSDLCIVSFGCKTGAELLECPPSKRKIIKSGGDLL